MTRKLSFTTMATPEDDHLGAIELAKKLGFAGVDLRCSDYKGEITTDMDDATLRAIGKDFADADIAIPSLLCYNKVQVDESDCWQLVRHELDQLLSIGAQIGVKSIRIFGCHAAKGECMSEFNDRWAEVLVAALEADDTGLDIIIQNHNKSHNAQQSAQLAQKVNSPRFGIVFSPDHLLWQNELETISLPEVLELVAPWTKELYISDMLIDDAGKRSVLPGDGIVPLKETVDFFDNRGFDGYISFKWEKLWNKELPEAGEALPKFVQYMVDL